MVCVQAKTELLFLHLFIKQIKRGINEDTKGTSKRNSRQSKSNL